MTTRTTRSIALAMAVASLFAALALALVLAMRGAPALAQSDADRTWVQKYFPVAFEDAFPIKQAAGDFIAVRAHRDFLNDLPEYSIVLEDTQDARAIRTTVREAQGSSLYQQLATLHSQDPSKSYAALKPALKVRTWTLSVDQCPAVAAQFKAFENVQFVRPRDDDDVAEHPIFYEFHESVGGGDSEVVEFTESRAFPKWANATHQALDSCIASAPGPAKNQ
jgi:hypothetical protein